MARARVIELGRLRDIELNRKEIVTGKGGSRIDEGVIGEAEVATSTVVWECLVLCNEEGHAFSTHIALGDYLEEDVCFKRDNGTFIVEQSYGLFVNYTSGASIEISSCVRVWDEPQDLFLNIQGCRSSRISITAGQTGDVEVRGEVAHIWNEVEVLRIGHGHAMCR